MSYFDKMRDEVREYAVRVIIRCYKAYTARKLIKMREEMAR